MGPAKHTVSVEALKELPQAISDPIAVFHSARPESPNAFVIMTELKDINGDTVVAAIHLSRRIAHHEVNHIAGLYGKNRKKWFGEEAEAGRLRYINKEKAVKWSQSVGQLFLPKEVTRSGSKTSVLTERDFVKPDHDEGISFKKGSFKQQVRDEYEGQQLYQREKGESLDRIQTPEFKESEQEIRNLLAKKIKPADGHRIESRDERGESTEKRERR